MTTGVAAPRAATSVWLAGYRAARSRFRRGQRLLPGRAPRTAAGRSSLSWPAARRASEALLGWLEDQEGGSWQERWLASGAEALGARWLQLPA